LRRACRLDLRFGLKSQLSLALGEHGARRDRVDPDAVWPQRPGEDRTLMEKAKLGREKLSATVS
jgi:hypothetical protein